MTQSIFECCLEKNETIIYTNCRSFEIALPVGIPITQGRWGERKCTPRRIVSIGTWRVGGIRDAMKRLTRTSMLFQGKLNWFFSCLSAKILYIFGCIMFACFSDGCTVVERFARRYATILCIGIRCTVVRCKARHSAIILCIGIGDATIRCYRRTFTVALCFCRS
jgi:hypothetical protein